MHRNPVSAQAFRTLTVTTICIRDKDTSTSVMTLLATASRFI